jgi:4-amino-4-deoxy-L-arabinose transferase-like glycosyltransferase
MIIETKQPASRSRTIISADLICVGVLFLFAGLVLLYRTTSVPMLLWDESRNANSALEMSRSGQWLVTHFNGVPDHWSTKPPLLIWMIASLLRLGLPAILAVRLPSIAAGFATALGVFFFCRYRLGDRAAGLFASLNLLTAPLFVGWHAARTGDFDSLVTLFTAAYCLAFWEYTEATDRKNGRWLAAAGVAVTLSVLTKGVGGVLALPALFVFALFRGQLSKMLKDTRFWLVLLGVLVISFGFYGLRNHFDPGYLDAVRNNEFSGRYLAVNEEHQGGPLFYVKVLATHYEPGFLLLPLCAIPFLRRNARCSSLVMFCLLVAAILFAVLSLSQTKVFWYLDPVTPFLALASGVGLSQGLEWIKHRGTDTPIWQRWALPTVFLIYCLGALATVYYYQIGLQHKLDQGYMGGRYGRLLDQVRKRGYTNALTIVDEGVSVPGGPPEIRHNYHPEADFYRKLETARGMDIRIIPPGVPLPSGSWIATCNPRSSLWLKTHYKITVVFQPNRWCSLDRTPG